AVEAGIAPPECQIGQTGAIISPKIYITFAISGSSQHMAGDKLEEGEDDDKSSWPLWAGLHTCYNGGKQKVAMPRGTGRLLACLGTLLFYPSLEPATCHWMFITR
ncbi:MAG: FAD-binding protein, partial [Candidatus Hodgkinia cicadicola]